VMKKKTAKRQMWLGQLKMQWENLNEYDER
jgi:hypothetical protein